VRAGRDPKKDQENQKKRSERRAEAKKLHRSTFTPTRNVKTLPAIPNPVRSSVVTDAAYEGKKYNVTIRRQNRFATSEMRMTGFCPDANE